LYSKLFENFIAPHTTEYRYIIAEDKLAELESYLGLHYPDSDIPRQAKYLYTLNFIRSIPQVNYQPVTILALDKEQEKPLDLSL
jgi:light-regulated signal transduction histidine kinase (bacteriophytochrome)